MSDFSTIVTEHWLKEMSGDTQHFDSESFSLTVNPLLDESSRITVLEVTSDKTWVTLSPEIAETLMLNKTKITSLEQLKVYLTKNNLRLHGADYLYYFPYQEQLNIVHETDKHYIRQLTPDDKNVFSQFEKQSSENDLDNAYVELDHWLVYGVFEGEKLVCVASMYVWDGTQLADIGVLTLDRFRGKGYAKKVVYAISKRAIQLGYEPQYRSQMDNHASIALANSLGLSLFAKWDVISPDCT